MKKDEIGLRMKNNYEMRTRTFLPRRTNTIIRIDGKAFHTLTKKFDKPFDLELTIVMDRVTQKLCENIQGCVMGYTQSDEISLLLQDTTKLTTDAWFDGQVQKMTSVAASMATAFFNKEMELARKRTGDDKYDVLGMFDARVFTIPETEEVINYLYWRQKDCVKNSISMQARSLFSHKELDGKNGNEMQEMMFQKGTNWNDLDNGLKRGRMVIKQNFDRPITKQQGEKEMKKGNENLVFNEKGYAIRTKKFTTAHAIDFHKSREMFRLYLESKFGDILIEA